MQALAANVNAARGLQDVLCTNLGPKGTLKMLVGGAGQIKLTKDGNVLLKEMHIQHPVAALIARAATAQDIVTGDGSSSAVLVCGEVMKLAEREVSEGVHPRKLSEGLDIAREVATEFLDKYFKRPNPNVAADRELLENIARCSLITKLGAAMTEKMTKILVDAILCLMGNDPASVSSLALHGSSVCVCIHTVYACVVCVCMHILCACIVCVLQIERDLEEGKIPLDLFMVEILAMKQGLTNETKFIRGMVMDHGCRHPDMPTSLKDCVCTHSHLHACTHPHSHAYTHPHSHACTLNVLNAVCVNMQRVTGVRED